jgi:hypothetical protein
MIADEALIARKWKLFRYALYGFVAAPPKWLWEDEAMMAERDAMHKFMGNTPEETDLKALGMKVGEGRVIQWVQQECGKIWQGEETRWFKEYLQGWWERIGYFV